MTSRPQSQWRYRLGVASFWKQWHVDFKKFIPSLELLFRWCVSGIVNISTRFKKDCYQRYVQQLDINFSYSHTRQELTKCTHTFDTGGERDIIFRRMNLTPSAQQETYPQRLTAHLDSAIRRLSSLPHYSLHYIGIVKFAKAPEMPQHLKEINLVWCDLGMVTMLIFQPLHDTIYLSHANTITCAHPAYSAQYLDYITISSCTLHAALTPHTQQTHHTNCHIYWSCS